MRSSLYPITKHFILSLDPTAKHEWDRCTLRNPLTAEHPDLPSLVAEAVGEEAGSYLVAITLEVQVLDRASVLPPQRIVIDVPVASPVALPLKELVA